MFLFLFFLSEIRKQEILKSFLKNLKKKKKSIWSVTWMKAVGGCGYSIY